MAVDRPVSGEIIAADWGAEVHDRTFAPRGTQCHGSVARACGSTALHIDLDVADNDPGGWLDAGSDQVEVPTGGDGLYGCAARFDTQNGTAGEYTRAYVYVNGVAVISSTAVNAGATHVPFTVFDYITLTAGDILQCFAQKVGATNVDVQVKSLTLIRHGDEVGA